MCGVSFLSAACTVQTKKEEVCSQEAWLGTHPSSPPTLPPSLPLLTKVLYLVPLLYWLTAVTITHYSSVKAASLHDFTTCLPDQRLVHGGQSRPSISPQ